MKRGSHHSEETRKKMSESHKGQEPWNKGKPSPFRGIPQSEETKRKISESHKGLKHSEETKQKISKSLKGRESPLKGRKFPGRKHRGQFQKGHMSWVKGKPSPMKGRHLSEETKQKMSESHKGWISPFWGVPRSEETRQKISLALGGTGDPEDKDGYYPPGYFHVRPFILQRDNYTCQLCGMTEVNQFGKTGRQLHIHHIDYDRTNNDTGNLITLCSSCHPTTNVRREEWLQVFDFYWLDRHQYYGTLPY